jgi:3-isopropylmalate dehydrogenase
MLLRWSLGRPDAAQAIEQAVHAALAAGLRTPDLGGTATTSSFTAAVVEHLAAVATESAR